MGDGGIITLVSSYDKNQCEHGGCGSDDCCDAAEREVWEARMAACGLAVSSDVCRYGLVALRRQCLVFVAEILGEKGGRVLFRKREAQQGESRALVIVEDGALGFLGFEDRA